MAPKRQPQDTSSSEFNRDSANDKRPAETTENVSNIKKSKSVVYVDLSSTSDDSKIMDKKRARFSRLFTKQDEIVLLECMIAYKKKNNVDPSLDWGGFHDYVNAKLSCKVNRRQIGNKINKLKKKFWKRQNGEAHKCKLFELSKNIWGQVVGDNVVGSKMEDTCWSLYPFLCTSLESEAKKNFTGPMPPKIFVKKVISGLGKEKARDLEQEWERFFVMEQQVHAARAKQISKQVHATMEILKIMAH